MSSRNNPSIDMKPNHVKNFDFMSILYSKPPRKYKKSKFEIGDRVRISKYDLLFRKGFKSQFTQERKCCHCYNKTSNNYSRRRAGRSSKWEILREGTN